MARHHAFYITNRQLQCWEKYKGMSLDPYGPRNVTQYTLLVRPWILINHQKVVKSKNQMKVWLTNLSFLERPWLPLDGLQTHTLTLFWGMKFFFVLLSFNLYWLSSSLFINHFSGLDHSNFCPPRHDLNCDLINGPSQLLSILIKLVRSNFDLSLRLKLCKIIQLGILEKILLYLTALCLFQMSL